MEEEITLLASIEKRYIQNILQTIKKKFCRQKHEKKRRRKARVLASVGRLKVLTPARRSSGETNGQINPAGDDGDGDGSVVAGNGDGDGVATMTGIVTATVTARETGIVTETGMATMTVMVTVTGMVTATATAA